MRDDGAGIRCIGKLLPEPVRFVFASGIAQELVNVLQAVPRKDTFITDAAVLVAQIAKQLDLEIISGSEIAVTAFAGKGAAPHAIPVQPSFAEPGAGRDEGSIAVSRSGVVQWHEIFEAEIINSRCVCLKIIDQPHGCDL